MLRDDDRPKPGKVKRGKAVRKAERTTSPVQDKAHRGAALHTTGNDQTRSVVSSKRQAANNERPVSTQDEQMNARLIGEAAELAARVSSFSQNYTLLENQFRVLASQLAAERENSSTIVTLRQALAEEVARAQQRQDGYSQIQEELRQERERSAARALECEQLTGDIEALRSDLHTRTAAADSAIASLEQLLATQVAGLKQQTEENEVLKQDNARVVAAFEQALAQETLRLKERQDSYDQMQEVLRHERENATARAQEYERLTQHLETLKLDLETHTANADSRIASLEAALAASMAGLEQQTHENEGLKRENARVIAAFEQANEVEAVRLKQLQDSYHQMQEELRHEREHATARADECDRLTEDLEALRLDLQTRVASANAAMESLEQSLATQVARLNQQATENEILKEQKSRAEIALEQALAHEALLLKQQQDRYDQVREELRQERARLADTTKECDRLNEKLDSLRLEIRDGAAELSKTKEELAAANSLVSRARQKVAELSDANEVTANELRDARSEVSGLSEAMQRAHDNESSLRSALAKSRIENGELRERLLDVQMLAEAYAAEAESAVGDLKDQLAFADLEKARIEEQLTKAQRAISDAAAQAESIVADLQSQIASVSLEKTSLERELSDTRCLSASLTTENDTAIETLKQLAASNEAQLREESTSLRNALEREQMRQNQYQEHALNSARLGIAATRSYSYRIGRSLRIRQKDPHEEVDKITRAIADFISQFESRQLNTDLEQLPNNILMQVLGMSDEVCGFEFFRASSYYEMYPDVAESGMHPIWHYLKFGQLEGRNPTLLFDTNFYLKRHPEAATLGETPFTHFVKWGADKKFDPHPLFDTAGYLDRYRDVAIIGMNPLLHFLRHPTCTTHILFDPAYYLATNTDVAAAGVIPILHFLRSGAREGRNPHPLFDTKFYVSSYPEVASDQVNPLVHFVTQGIYENRQPNPHFDGDFYRAQYPDVDASGMPSFLHYLKVGRDEGRECRRQQTRPSVASDRLVGQPSVLMIDAMYPRPDQDAGSHEQIGFAKIFQRLGYAVSFAADVEFGLATNYKSDLEAMDVRCVSYNDYQSIDELIASPSADFDVYFLSRVHFGGRHVEQIRASHPRAKIIFNTVDLHFLREEREAELKGDQEGLRRAAGTRTRELSVIGSADANIVLSTAELALLSKEISTANVSVVPLIREYPDGILPGFGARSDIAFIGGYAHQPNVDAVEYFLDEIWPLVRVGLPAVRFHVIGSNLPAKLASRNDKGVDFVGFVPEIESRLDQLRLTVAPLRYGAGVKGKVASSLGRGVPCVATSMAAEGTGLEPSLHIAVADNPRDFAEAIIELYTNEPMWTAQSSAGREFMREKYSLEVGIELVRGMLDKIGAIRTR